MTKKSRQKNFSDIHSAFSINQSYISDQLYMLAAFGSLSKQSGDVCTASYMELLGRLCAGSENLDSKKS